MVGSKFDPSNPPHPEEDEEKKITSQTVKSLLEREVRYPSLPPFLPSSHRNSLHLPQLYDADLVVLLTPLVREKHRKRPRLQRILLERSVSGLTYMEGGALGFVSAGLEHDVDSGATLAIRQSSSKTMDKLMEQLELGNHHSQCHHLIYLIKTELSINLNT